MNCKLYLCTIHVHSFVGFKLFGYWLVGLNYPSSIFSSENYGDLKITKPFYVKNVFCSIPTDQINYIWDAYWKQRIVSNKNDAIQYKWPMIGQYTINHWSMYCFCLLVNNINLHYPPINNRRTDRRTFWIIKLLCFQIPGI